MYIEDGEGEERDEEGGREGRGMVRERTGDRC